MADQRHSRWGGCFLLLAICMLCVKNGTAYTFNPSPRISALQPIQNSNRAIRDSINLKASSNFKLSVLRSELSSDSENKAVIVPFLNIANILTISRVIAIPFLMLAFVMRRKSLGVFIYVVSCLTDFLDGYLARKFKLSSPFGAFLDPVADKLMVATALIMLVCQLPTWWFAIPVAVIMCREIGVSALREWMAERGQRNSVQVGNLGKIKTTTQMIATAILLEACPGPSSFDVAAFIRMPRPAFFTTGVALLYIATVLTVISGFQYLVAAWPVLVGNPTLEVPKEDSPKEEPSPTNVRVPFIG